LAIRRRPFAMSETEPIAAGKPKREAKVVQHFVPQEIKEKSALVIGEGAGTKLGDIDNVKIRIDKLNAGGDELKALHRLCFGRPGEKSKIKSALRLFSGFTGGDAEVSKKKETASKLDSKTLKSLLTTCDQPTTGTKADNVESLMSFLTEPSESGKKSLAVKAGEKRARAAAKKERAEKKTTKGKKKGGKEKPALKRPLSAFMLYSQAKREKVVAENPDAAFTEIGKIMGEKWKGISDERKAKYQAEAAKLKEEYEKAKAALEAKSKPKSGGEKPAKKQKVEEKEDDDDDDDDDEEEEKEEEEKEETKGDDEPAAEEEEE